MALADTIGNFGKALKRFEEAHTRAVSCKREDDYSFFRDSAIQRFEFTVEIFWKAVKAFLKEMEGIDCRTPKYCVREFFSAGYLDEESTLSLLKMIDDRNLASHTYREEIAEEIFLRLQEYLAILRRIHSRLQEALPGEKG